jgi:exopolysaccharide biosynthesis polyprenyl glycosylphosphotransferase
MERPQINSQVASPAQIHTQTGHTAPPPTPLPRPSVSGALQWLLQGKGLSLLRPSADLCFSAVAVLAAIGGPAAVHRHSARTLLLLLPVLIVVVFYMQGAYRRTLRARSIGRIGALVAGVSIADTLVLVLGVLLTGKYPGAEVWLRAWAFALLGVVLGRGVMAGLNSWGRGRGIVGRRVLIVGAGVVGARIARSLERRPEYGLEPVGFLDEDPLADGAIDGCNLPVLGTPDDLEQAVRHSGVKDVVVAFSSVGDARLNGVIQTCQDLDLNVSVVPRMFDTINDRVHYDTVGGLPVLSLGIVDPKGFKFAIKHLLDLVIGLGALVAFAPVMVLAALAVRLTSPGPILFKQLRVGRDGKSFELYKFRSMRIDPTYDEEPASDPSRFMPGHDTAPGGVEGQDRRTAVGRVLRRTSVDELPQLFNVLRGQMSLVGPRPERPEFVELYSRGVARYDDRHRVRCGITGWAQVSGLRGQTSLAERVEWDNYYIGNWSLRLDARILAMTVLAVFRKAE